MVKVVRWNGRDVPPELKELPPGRYVVESVDEAPELTAQQEHGLREALRSLERGEARSLDEVKAGLTTVLP